MTLIKSLMIDALDMFDHYVVRHRSIQLCEACERSDWWPSGDCQCWYCKRNRFMWAMLESDP